MEYKDFENALKALEEIVGKLEKGDLALEEALKLFEDGVRISRFCTSKLEEAERKIEILVRNEKGELQPQPFETSTD